jgi:hypothetical protein
VVLEVTILILVLVKLLEVLAAVELQTQLHMAEQLVLTELDQTHLVMV